MQNRAAAIVMHWLPLGAAILLFGFMAILMAQQALRANLNDPQIQMVGDAVARLEQGASPEGVVATSSFDAAYSLSPFVAVYDQDGSPLAWSATVNGEAPKPPAGVFEYAKEQGWNRLTWQPEEKTRIALVVRPVGTGERYVAAGRNMDEAEGRIWMMVNIGISVTLMLLIVTLMLEVLGDWWRRRAYPVA